MNRFHPPSLRALLAALPLWAVPVTASAQDAAAVSETDAAASSALVPHQRFTLTVGSGKLLSLPMPAGSEFVADPSVADLQPASTTRVFVFGKKPGETTLFALTRDGRPMLAYRLVVEYDQRALHQAIAAEAPGSDVSLQRVPNGLVIHGTVPSPAAAAHLEEVARSYLGGGERLVDRLAIDTPVQVNLRVRVAEVSRSVSRQLGFNWNTVFNNLGSFAVGLQTGGLASTAVSSLSGLGTSSSVVNAITGTVTSRHASGTLTLDAMADEGLVTLLAEPNLTTLSGAAASFQAGGQYPIPVPQGLGTVGIEYKNYGVSIAFTPTVLSSGLINMKVTPEVSELSSTGSYTLPGTTLGVPALVTRRADTTVELASGQSFAIGGLIQNNAQNNVSKIPWLGDLPVLGALFRSTQFQRDETELVIVVTAYVVHPTDSVPALPTDYVRQSTDLERLLLDRVLMQGGSVADPVRLPHLRGAAGFLFQ